MSSALTPARLLPKIAQRGLGLWACLIVACAAFGEVSPIYTVPIRVHLVTGAEFQADGRQIAHWVTPDDFTREVLPEINRIWHPAGVQWQVVALTTEAAPQNSAATKALALIEQREKEAGSIRALLPDTSPRPHGEIDLYLLPSIGPANGVAFPKDKIAVVAIWRKPGKRPYHRAPLVQTTPPYVSVAKTCAHELGHNLGLKHPDPSLKDRLMIAGPGLDLTAEEIATARRVAKSCDVSHEP